MTVRTAERSRRSHKRNGTAVRLSRTAAQSMTNAIPTAIRFVATISSPLSAPSESIDIPHAADNIPGKSAAAAISLPKRVAVIALPMNFPLKSMSEKATVSDLPSAKFISRAAKPHHNGGITRNRSTANIPDITTCSAYSPVNRFIGFIFPKYSIRQYSAASAVLKNSSVPTGIIHISRSSLRRPFTSRLE